MLKGLNVEVMKRRLSFWLVLLFLIGGVACTNDDDGLNATGDPEEIEEGDPDGPAVAEVFQEGYVLVNDPGNNRAYILDKTTLDPVFEWELPYRLGNDAKLMEDGVLMASLRAPDPEFSFGGFGGRIHFITPDGSSSWEIDLSNDQFISHHDVIRLPNGHVMTMLWERVLPDEAVALGYRGAQDTIFTESIVEIDPNTDQVVWKWDSRDHLIQEDDPEGNNYGDVSENPQLIDMAYRDTVVTTIPDNGDFMHANALAYDAVNDVVLMSVNYYSEIWFIDHSTAAAEVSSSQGGRYGRGGDLIYRMGNPSAYKNVQGQRLFYNNHNPRFVEGTDHLLVFMNGNNTMGPSVVYELDLPDQYVLLADSDNEPLVVWQYTDPEMYSDRVSGAERLPNGNTLIAIGALGYWEVNADGEILWRYEADGFFWRGYHIPLDYPALEVLGVD